MDSSAGSSDNCSNIATTSMLNSKLSKNVSLFNYAVFWGEALLADWVFFITALEAKRGSLEELERSEAEARRLDSALDRAAARVRPLDGEGEIESDGGGSRREETGTISPPPEYQPASPSSPPPPSSPTGSLRRSGSNTYRLFGAISQTFQGIVDVDPESARRNNIGKTRETIEQVCFPYYTAH
jgi:hypothetical protein